MYGFVDTPPADSLCDLLECTLRSSCPHSARDFAVPLIRVRLHAAIAIASFVRACRIIDEATTSEIHVRQLTDDQFEVARRAGFQPRGGGDRRDA
jgi:hypothetical protein